MAWVVGVEAPEEIAEGGVRVTQGERDLEEDDRFELRWALADPLGAVTIRWRDETEEERERLFETGRTRLFKVARSGVKGRAVSQVMRGHCLVVSPGELTRDEERGRPAPVAAERVLPESKGLLAHHLLVGEEEEDGLVLAGPDAETIDLRPLTARSFELRGHRVQDAHEMAGPLFGREPPRLETVGDLAPSLVVVGLEGPVAGRRPRAFSPSFDELRSWFDRHEPGWFFVRLYDERDDLIDSLDFRYARHLEAIEIEEQPVLPGPEGHRPTGVDFRLTGDGLSVSAIEAPGDVRVGRDARSTTVLLPPRPDATRTTWRLHRGKDRDVEVVLHVPRLWWALADEESVGSDAGWTDRPQSITREAFRPTSSLHVGLLLPATGWAGEAWLGFAREASHPLRILRTERTAWFPLRNLGGNETLHRGDDALSLRLWIRAGGIDHGPVEVVRVARPDAPASESETGDPDFSGLGAPRLMALLSRVRRSGTAAERRAIGRLRETWYRKARRGGNEEAREFARRGVSLLTAILSRREVAWLPARWRRRAERLARTAPLAVAEWGRALREPREQRREPELGEEGGRA